MRRLGTLFLLLLAATLIVAETVPSLPAPTAYVDDYAHVLTPDGQARIEAICRDMHAKTQAQIFLVTIHTLAGEDIAPFANQLFHQWKIGEAKTDRGLLVLLAIDDHKRRIEVGYGLEGVLNDAKVGDIGRAMVPALQQADYDQAGLVAVQALANIVAADANVALSPAPLTPAAKADPDEGSNSGVVILLLFVVGVVAVFAFIWWLLRRTASTGSRSYLGSQGSDTVAPIFIPSSTSDDTSSSSPAPDSPSSSSSDDSSFSGGGGGDSGGGGADGGW